MTLSDLLIKKQLWVQYGEWTEGEKNDQLGDHSNCPGQERWQLGKDCGTGREVNRFQRYLIELACGEELRMRAKGEESIKDNSQISGLHNWMINCANHTEGKIQKDQIWGKSLCTQH